MSTSHRSLLSLMGLALAASLLSTPLHANQLVYVTLDKPCRLLDTRPSTGSGVPLTAAHGAYLFGTTSADIAAQHGNSGGCGIPANIEAVSVNMNLLDATAAGNIATWSANAGPTAPNIGTAVYNPTVASPMAGQVQYNTGYTSVPVANGGTNVGRFYLQVANGQIDMTINVVGYWRAISWAEALDGNFAISLGLGAAANGAYSIAMSGATAGGFESIAIGYLASTTADADNSTALGRETTAGAANSLATGYKTSASGAIATAMGNQTHASGPAAVAMGEVTTASGHASTAMGETTAATGNYSTAMGFKTSADGDYSIAMGSQVGSGGHTGSFIYGDASRPTGIVNDKDNQFMAIADGGFVLVSKSDGSTGVELKHGNSSWTTLSDRNAKTAVQPVDGREVLKKVAALPLNTWQYKAQDAKYRHMGPMAQDFYAAFQLGESDKGIDTVDADGVALAAIQGLNALLADKEREIGNLRAELATQKTRVASLESLAAELAEVKAQVAALRESAPKKVAVALQEP